MTKQEIEKLLAKYQRQSELNFQHYQETGARRYQAAYEQAEDIVDVCRMALTAADDHEDANEYKAYICEWASEAIKLMSDGIQLTGQQRVEQLLKNIAAVGRMHGVADPYEREGR